jgi:hypothetical protein
MARGRFWVWSTQASVIGVLCTVSWPCGQDSEPKPECHQRRDLRHEAGGVGLLVLTAGLVPYLYRRYTTGPVVASLSH